MANPNIVNVTAIYGNTLVSLVTNANANSQNLVVNAQSSGKIYKINSLYVSNYHGTNAADITINHRTGSNEFSILSTVSVVADSTLVPITKDSSIYLMENCQINMTTNTNSVLSVLCSWDEIN